MIVNYLTIQFKFVVFKLFSFYNEAHRGYPKSVKVYPPTATTCQNQFKRVNNYTNPPWLNMAEEEYISHIYYEN